MRPHDPTRIRLLCLDVDGVLTDGSVLIDDAGVETKRFFVRDGTAIRMWQRSGGLIAIITGRRGEALRHRARELGIEHLLEGVDRKGEEFYQISLGGRADEKAAIGDVAGPALKGEDVPQAVKRIVDTYMALRTSPDELFIDTLARTGAEPFKEAVYATA